MNSTWPDAVMCIAMCVSCVTVAIVAILKGRRWFE